VADPEVVTDYSSGGCVRFARTSLLLEPGNLVPNSQRETKLSFFSFFVKKRIGGEIISKTVIKIF
jgi:hypothetical protein